MVTIVAIKTIAFLSATANILRVWTLYFFSSMSQLQAHDIYYGSHMDWWKQRIWLHSLLFKGETHAANLSVLNAAGWGEATKSNPDTEWEYLNTCSVVLCCEFSLIEEEKNAFTKVSENHCSQWAQMDKIIQQRSIF